MIVHAAGESAKNLTPETHAVVLAADSEAALLRLENRLLHEGVPHAAFREPDRGGELMSIGIEPVEDRRMVRRYLKGFPLIGEEPCPTGKKNGNA